MSESKKEPEIWVSAAPSYDWSDPGQAGVVRFSPPEPPHQNILPDGSAADGFRLEGDCGHLAAWTHTDGTELTLEISYPDEAYDYTFDLTRKQALELAYWLLATAEKLK